ncbi:hypothetical protein HPP92_007987 [Vanilla planifolia]|uniref:Uncharacterized protein n=1 Tax=Vanilla planifolia TaxID=51239 RepID=A0A835V878_VANPL|nr:hypothetical protein HPP92_007987 [Vanilla planifolia]
MTIRPASQRHPAGLTTVTADHARPARITLGRADHADQGIATSRPPDSSTADPRPTHAAKAGNNASPREMLPRPLHAGRAE